MNFLALDTSGGYLTVVAYKNGEVFSTYVPDCAMKQSTLVMGAVDETLKKANLTVKECDCFAAVVGAGSFTGIRIGISVAKGFALAYGKPTIPVTSFEVMAYDGLDGNTLCLVDALHGHYYACAFDGDTQTLAPVFWDEEEVTAYALQTQANLVSLTALECSEKVRIADPVHGLLCAVQAKAEKGLFGELNALYVRKSSAEENLAK